MTTIELPDHVGDRLPLAAAERIELLRQMIRIRRFEERCVQLYSAEKIRGFLHLYVGEEAVAAGLLRQIGAEDAVVSTYREHGTHSLAAFRWRR